MRLINLPGKVKLTLIRRGVGTVEDIEPSLEMVSRRANGLPTLHPVSLGRRDRRAEEIGKPIIDNEPRALIEPLLPPPKPHRIKYPGRKPVADRAALTGILLALKTGIRCRDCEELTRTPPIERAPVRSTKAAAALTKTGAFRSRVRHRTDFNPDCKQRMPYARSVCFRAFDTHRPVTDLTGEIDEECNRSNLCAPGDRCNAKPYLGRTTLSRPSWAS